MPGVFSIDLAFAPIPKYCAYLWLTARLGGLKLPVGAYRQMAVTRKAAYWPDRNFSQPADGNRRTGICLLDADPRVVYSPVVYHATKNEVKLSIYSRKNMIR